MSISQQRRIIAVTSMVTFALGFLTTVTKNKSYDEGARFFIGIGFAYTVVSVLSDMGSELGAGFAILIMLAAILKEGNGIIDWLTQRSTAKPKTPKNVRGSNAAKPASATAHAHTQPIGPVGPGFLPGGH